jgi:hypothetical protein
MTIFDHAVPLEPGGRRIERPKSVETCTQCGEAVGTNYPGCPGCYRLVERFWLADWQALLGQQGVEAGSPEETPLAADVFEQMDRHPWTVVDIAMTLILCGECGSELGGGPLKCSECRMALGNSGYYDNVAGQQGRMTGNEHALRVGRRMLRHPHRYPETALRNWRLSFPRLLTGWLPSTRDAQTIAALMKDGHEDRVRDMLRKLDREIAEGRA